MNFECLLHFKIPPDLKCNAYIRAISKDAEKWPVSFIVPKNTKYLTPAAMPYPHTKNRVLLTYLAWCCPALTVVNDGVQNRLIGLVAD